MPTLYKRLAIERFTSRWIGHAPFPVRLSRTSIGAFGSTPVVFMFVVTSCLPCSCTPCLDACQERWPPRSYPLHFAFFTVRYNVWRPCQGREAAAIFRFVSREFVGRTAVIACVKAAEQSQLRVLYYRVVSERWHASVRYAVLEI